MPNTEMLLTLKDWVRSEWDKKEAGLPSEWKQTWWLTGTDCGTACCVAGKAALLDGWTVHIELAPNQQLTSVEKDGLIENIETIALEVLGLNLEEGDQLFYASNTVKDIEMIIDQIVAGTFDAEKYARERG